MTITGTGTTDATRVQFNGGSGVVKTVPLDAPSSSDTEITITAPDLSSLADQIPSGADALATDVVVGIPDVNAIGGFVDSAVGASDQFNFVPPAPPCGDLSDCDAATSTDTNGSATATSTDDSGSVSAEGSGAGGITVGRYGSDPVGAPSFNASGAYFDVKTTTPDTFTSVTIHVCDLAGGNTVEWWNPAGGGGAGAWQLVSNEVFSAGPPPCVTITIDGSSGPSLNQLTGTVFGVAIVKTPQAIAFTSSAPVGALVGDSYVVSATGRGSGLPVVFSIDVSAVSVCSITGSKVNLIGAGLCVIDAIWRGTLNICRHPRRSSRSRSRSRVDGWRRDRVLEAEGPAMAQSRFSVTASAFSRLPVTFRTTTPSVCSVTRRSVSLLAAGKCTVVASQAGNGKYKAVANVARTFAVSRVAQTIAFKVLRNRTCAVADQVSAVTSTGPASDVYDDDTCIFPGVFGHGDIGRVARGQGSARCGGIPSQKRDIQGRTARTSAAASRVRSM